MSLLRQKVTKQLLPSSYNVRRRYLSSIKKSNDYQYIQRSKIPTMHFQKSLPRLPIPILESTCTRYLAAQRPLLNNETFERTAAHVKNFQRSSGKILNDKLIAEDKLNKHTSYISGPWFDMYLRDRTPLPINYNPILVFEKGISSAYDTQLIRSTNMLISSLRFMKSLRDNHLEPEVFHMNPKKSDTPLFRTITSFLPSAISWYGAYMFKAYPLDMSQYKNLFNSTRIPDVGKDRIYQNTDAKHVLVMRNGHFYIFDALDEGGNILPPNKLLARMEFVLKDNLPPAEYPIGIFTTENRNVWAEIRQHLCNINNEQTLSLIDSALFNIILDNEEISSSRRQMVRHFLHGTGQNRWFDKAFSLIFSKDGIGAVNFEHSWGDGVAVLRYFQDIYRDSIDNPEITPENVPDSRGVEESVKKLNINLDEKIKSNVIESTKKYKSVCDSLDVNYILTDGIGKNLCKKHSVSPDAIMQLGFQSAFYKQNAQFVGSYESCSTAAFKHGRTETIRPCTNETKAFCEAINSRNRPSNEQLYSMIRECSKRHGTLTKEAAMGQGFDRHLFALKLIAEKHGYEIPSIYTDPSYAFINYNVISTSTLSSPAVQAGGFGPVVPDGYGIAYRISDDSLGTLVTNYSEHRNGPDYVDCLKKSYEEIKDVLISK